MIWNRGDGQENENENENEFWEAVKEKSNEIL